MTLMATLRTMFELGFGSVTVVPGAASKSRSETSNSDIMRENKYKQMNVRQSSENNTLKG